MLPKGNPCIIQPFATFPALVLKGIFLTYHIYLYQNALIFLLRQKVYPYDKALEYSRLDACVFPVRDMDSKEVIMLNTLDIFSIKDANKGGSSK